MGMIRSVLRDRVSASAIALLVACLLMIQGLLSGQAQGAMAAISVDPLQAICSIMGEVSLQQVDKDDASHGSSHGKAADCPCCTLCRLASFAMPAILGADTAVAHVALDMSDVMAVAVDTPIRPALRRLIAQPRAPPFVS
jgi:hypothetical protein